MHLIKGNYLKIYIGCMYSGKTTSLLNEISKYKVISSNIIVINHVLDKLRRKSMNNFTDTSSNDSIEFGEIISHDNKSYTSIMTNSLSELKTLNAYISSDIVIIDEAQFFDDLYLFLYNELNKNHITKKIFIVGGLLNDYNMQPIGDIIKIIPLADEIIKLNAYCLICNDGSIASFSKRIINDPNQILIGKEDLYIPVCRFHFINS
jgi:thymidine kinase